VILTQCVAQYLRAIHESNYLLVAIFLVLYFEFFPCIDFVRPPIEGNPPAGAV